MTNAEPEAQTPILVEREGGVVSITLNRPHRKNALNSAMAQMLIDEFRTIGGNPADRCVLLKGAGGAFCSGGDLTEVHTVSTLTMMRSTGRLAIELRALPQPTIAAVGGVAYGAGWNLALGCDFVVAGESATFAQVFAKNAMTVDLGGSWLLPRLVGMIKARELVLLGDTLTAEEAHKAGLVSRLVSDADLDDAATSLAQRLAAGPTLSMSLTKRLLDEAFGHSLEQAVEAEARAQAIALRSRNTREALKAFRERRSPHFEADL